MKHLWTISVFLTSFVIFAIFIFSRQKLLEPQTLFIPHEGCENKLDKELELFALRKLTYDLEFQMKSLKLELSELKMQEDTQQDRFFVKPKSNLQNCESFQSKSRLFQLKLPKVPLRLRSRHRIQVGPSQPLDCHEKNLKKHPDLRETGKAIIWSEIKGQYETLNVISKYSSSGVYNLDFEITLPGFYTVSTYIGMSQLYALQKVVIPANQIKAGTKMQRMQYCKAEEVGKQKGRWVSCEELVGDVSGMEECTALEKKEIFDFDAFPKWRWLPYPCQVSQLSKKDIKSCALERNIKRLCFFGGLDMLFRMYHIHYRITDKECNDCDISTNNKRIYAKDFELSFFWDPFNEKFQMAINGSSDIAFQSIRTCDVILFNWGIDFLLSKNSSSPSFSSSYQPFLRNLETSVQNFIEKVESTSTQLIWINNFISNQKELYPTILHLNEAVDSLIDKYGITRIDAFSISFGRMLNSPDKRFFATRIKGIGWGGSVENAVSNIIWHILCGEMFQPSLTQDIRSNSSLVTENFIAGDEKAIHQIVQNEQVFEEAKSKKS